MATPTPSVPSFHRPFVISLLLYAAITVWIGRGVLAAPASTVANDVGDPLLTAAILHWDAHHIPLTDEWWQFPNFYPVRDTLAFSEHLLGIAVISAPLDWITGSALAAYNLTVLLTFVLSAAAMYALVFRISGSAAGACVAGLAYAFSPFRIGQLTHVQMLAGFWAPLALLGLHAFVESGRRRWLALYAAALTLQGAASVYALVFLAVVAGLWVAWFVLFRRRWRELALIVAVTAAAVLVQVPVLLRYAAVHGRHGFTRSLAETQAYSADLGAVLCAPAPLTLWGWVRAGCRSDSVEGMLFPGVAVLTLVLGGIAGALLFPVVDRGRLRRALGVTVRVLCGVAFVYAGVIVSVLVAGGWQFDVGPVHVSATSVRNPMLVAIASLALAVVLSPQVHAAVRRASTPGFYLVAAAAAWLLALGPAIAVFGEPTGLAGPFAALRLVPGVSGLRAPARFWMMASLALAATAGIVVAKLLEGRSRRFAAGAVVVIGAGVLADGWIDRISAVPAPLPVPDAAALEGQVVLTMAATNADDTAAQWRAALGGWTSVNGFSGYVPSHYPALRSTMRFEDDAVLHDLRRSRDLHVIVPVEAPRLVRLIERQPGQVKTGSNGWSAQYRLPRRDRPDISVGDTLPIAALTTPCGSTGLELARDADEATRWVCATNGTPALVIDLGRSHQVDGFVQRVGRRLDLAPLALIVETSIDGEAWQEAWNGFVLGPTMRGALANPAALAIVLPIGSRAARYVRVQAPPPYDEGFEWSIAEVEVRGARIAVD